MVKYNKPPIIESVCEIRFTEDTNWDITVPGLLFEDVRKEYPQKGQRSTQEISISMSGTPSDKNHSKIKRQDFAVFRTADKKSLIQVGPRILLTSQSKPYGTWEDFKSQVDYAFQKLRGRVEPVGIQRIGLRYINRIEIQMEDGKVNLDKYFEFRPFCGSRLPQLHREFIVGCVFPFSDERDLCRVEFTTAIPEKEGSLAFLLSIDYFLNKPRSVPITQTIEWVENAHAEIEKLFEGCILPPAREIFGEVKE